MQSSHCVATPIATAIRRLPRAPADPYGRIQARAGYSPACPRSAEIRDSARDRSCPSWASMQPASDGRNLPRRALRRIARAEADTHPANHIARHRGGAAMRPPRKTIGEHVNRRPIDARQRGAAHRALARRHGPSQTIVRQRHRSSRKSIAELDAPRRGNRPKEAVVTGATPGAAAAVQFRARAAPTDCDARRPVQPRRAAANHALTAPATHASPLVTMPARPLAAFAPAPCLSAASVSPARSRYVSRRPPTCPPSKTHRRSRQRYRAPKASGCASAPDSDPRFTACCLRTRGRMTGTASNARIVTPRAEHPHPSERKRQRRTPSTHTPRQRVFPTPHTRLVCGRSAARDASAYANTHIHVRPGRTTRPRLAIDASAPARAARPDCI